jgi:GNAT superfamily N-acetyltransferase
MVQRSFTVAEPNARQRDFTIVRLYNGATLQQRDFTTVRPCRYADGRPTQTDGRRSCLATLTGDYTIMRLIRYTYAEQPDSKREVFQAVKQPAWQYDFMFEDEVANRWWDRLEDDFADYQFVLRDEDAGGAIAAVGHTLPFFWAAPLTELPDRGWDGIFEQAMADADAGRTPNLLTAIEASVAPAYQGKGVSRRVIETMRDLAQAQGYASLVAPVRPSRKAQYPLTAMERYITWTDESGAPFDPWLRTHWRLGARIVKVAPQSMRIPGTVAKWERWTGLKFPESGPYIVPGALEPVQIDRERDLGVYVEPNVWMHHAIAR